MIFYIMDYTKLLMLKIDCSQDVLTREQFHKAIQSLKIFPEYFQIILESYK